jgi:hypothetical protein
MFFIARSKAPFAALVAAALLSAPNASADADYTIGIQLSVGGRYDDVRLCVASGEGTKGGPAADLSFFAEFPVDDEIRVLVNLPVMRPILFGAAFGMLQFEPYATLLFRVPGNSDFDFLVGPSLGVTLHYGPDYVSEATPKFFALGPTVGGYFGFDFIRPGELFNFQLGLHPYFTPLWGVDDPAGHQGFVVGGMLEGLFLFTPDAGTTPAP